ncbi:N-acetylmuramoyl-L-alanine amidase [Anaerobacillus sp. 1_MG-2023]|uniref:N-acetylmuramoyl-L-alanine amidase n=1 Tax=Bacillales TaxID=1385 RepID=UPI0026E34A06|nr:N-acetylmuramoyl-L-alanine amidase [Anaerobacillus sp. 1_MG-2023]MDO6656613.1 N-acetylmuramoyl-L-alanine amidase [Anaerobacillus sp. 1_MG-2023]
MIIIDAGHGGNDPGAVANGVKEKDWTMEVALHQYEFLKSLGIPCAITRTNDINLSSEKRSALVKGSGALICLSNHYNAGGGSGAEVIHSIYAKSDLAGSIAEALKKAGMGVRRVFSREGADRKDYYYMHRLTGDVETVIIEYGFLDSSSDVNKLKARSYRLQLAEEAVLAAVRYVKGALPQSLYYVQAGAYKEKASADQLCQKLKKNGYDAFVKKV